MDRYSTEINCTEFTFLSNKQDTQPDMGASPPKNIDEVENSFPKKGLHFLDGDTIVSPGSRQASSDAVASIITAIDSVQNKEFKNVFCPVRPPGHHAEKDKAMGFCIYNNVAVGAHYLIDKYKFNKIAIIDFDVHHGNGTQNIFYDNEKVLYISTHQYPFYPCLLYTSPSPRDS